MILSEVLNTLTRYSVKQSDPWHFAATFRISDNSYQYMANSDGDDHNIWTIECALLTNTPNPNDPDNRDRDVTTFNHDVTGTGNAFELLSAVAQITLNFIHLNPNATTIRLCADVNEQSRQKLFTRLSSRINIPGWKYQGTERSDPASGDDFIYYVFNKQVDND